MAIDLVKEIMNEIGLCMPESYQGQDCRDIRIAAAKRLPEVLHQHYLRGEVALPYSRLGEMMQAIAKYGDETNETLTVTWHVAVDLIRAHIEQAKTPKSSLEEECLKIANHHLPISRLESLRRAAAYKQILDSY